MPRLAAGLLCIVLAACTANRVNHVHSPGNLAKAKAAAEAFESATSSRTGLPAKMLANIDAQKSLRSSVAATTTELMDLTDLRMLNGLSWTTLRQEAFAEFGLYDQNDLPMLLFALRNSHAIQDVERRQGMRKRASALALVAASLSPESDLRNDLVRSPMDSFLGEYVELQVTESQQLESLALALANIGDELVAVTPDDVAQAVDMSLPSLQLRLDRSTDPKRESLREFIAGNVAREPEALGGQIRAAAPDVQQDRVVDGMNERLRLLSQVIMVYEALVKGERARLAIYKKAQADFIRQSAGESEPDKPSSDADEDVLDLVFAVKNAVTGHFSMQEVRNRYLELGNELQRLLINEAAASADPAAVYSLVPLTGEGLSAIDLSLMQEYLGALRDRLASLEVQRPDPPEKEPDATSAFLDALVGLRTALAAEASQVDLPRLLRGAIEASDALSIDLDILKSEEAGALARELSPHIQALIRSAGNGTLSDPDAETLLRAVVGPQRAEKLDKAVTALLRRESLDAIRALLSDIAKEDAAAAKRVADYVTALQKLHIQVFEENVRHYLALTSIARSEVTRWQNLSDLAQSFGRLYDNSNLFTGNPPSGAPRIGGVTIDHHHSVLGSMRLLTEAARTYHTRSPAQDPQGMGAEWWAQALAEAVEVVQTYQLLTSMNRRLAAENNIALIGEVGEHEVHLDNIVSSGVEEQIKLALADQVAFHASGISEADIQLLVSIAQAGILAWIGAEQ